MGCGSAAVDCVSSNGCVATPLDVLSVDMEKVKKKRKRREERKRSPLSFELRRRRRKLLWDTVRE
jgi:hypothetical protein